MAVGARDAAEFGDAEVDREFRRFLLFYARSNARVIGIGSFVAAALGAVLRGQLPPSAGIFATVAGLALVLFTAGYLLNRSRIARDLWPLQRVVEGVGEALGASHVIISGKPSYVEVDFTVPRIDGQCPLTLIAEGIHHKALTLVHGTEAFEFASFRFAHYELPQAVAFVMR